MKRRARHALVVEGGVRCELCPNFCLVANGRTGRCRGRRNIDGELYAVNYGEVVALGVDPIEKKPLYHFYPGADILSVSTYGCNLLCPFCQNCEISQQEAPARFIAPNALVRRASEAGAIGIAFTYTEPIIWFEYLMDVLPLLREQGLLGVLVTNGMVNPDPLSELLPLVDAMNIDLKSIRADFYRDYVAGDLETVLQTIRAARAVCHIELTTLLIPGRNDAESEVRELVEFAADLGRDTVLHLSRYFPRHKATEAATSEQTMMRAAAAARKKLDYVYVGNLPARPEFRDTHCPRCGNLLIDRRFYAGRVAGIRAGRCGKCGRQVDIAGVW